MVLQTKYESIVQANFLISIHVFTVGSCKIFKVGTFVLFIGLLLCYLVGTCVHKLRFPKQCAGNYSDMENQLEIIKYIFYFDSYCILYEKIIIDKVFFVIIPCTELHIITTYVCICICTHIFIPCLIFIFMENKTLCQFESKMNFILTL